MGLRRNHPSTFPLPTDLTFIKESFYDPIGVGYSHLAIDAESKAYGGVRFYLAGLWVVFRIAAITPKKLGQFVTLWKRNNQGTIQPYEASDALDIWIVCARKDGRFGAFIFPKAILLQHGILSQHREGGKRAMRIYPPWDNVTSKQAQASQQWQLTYFMELSNPAAIDLDRFKQLHALKLDEKT